MLSSRLSQFAAQLEARVDGVMLAGAEQVCDRAIARAPDAPPLGEGLVKAIHVEKGETPARYDVVAGNKDVFWGMWVELGTSHSAPHPFLVPALEETRSEILRNARAAISRP